MPANKQLKRRTQSSPFHIPIALGRACGPLTAGDRDTWMWPRASPITTPAPNRMNPFGHPSVIIATYVPTSITPESINASKDPSPGLRNTFFTQRLQRLLVSSHLTTVGSQVKGWKKPSLIEEIKRDEAPWVTWNLAVGLTSRSL